MWIYRSGQDVTLTLAALHRGSINRLVAPYRGSAPQVRLVADPCIACIETWQTAGLRKKTLLSGEHFLLGGVLERICVGIAPPLLTLA